uniref:Movement protein n=1 Tax=Switchgrass umbra-like virus 1 TaxID=3233123 RepID=A0AAU8MHA8_9TOMB
MSSRPNNMNNQGRRRNRRSRNRSRFNNQLGVALPPGISRQLAGSVPRVFETTPQRTESEDYVLLRDGERHPVMERMNEGLRGSRIILMEVRSEILEGDSIELRAGPGSLFAPFQHYHLRVSTGNHQDTVWIMNQQWDDLYTQWTADGLTDESGATLRGRIRATGRLVFRVWYRPANANAQPSGYSIPARTPMDFDNPDN